MSDNRPDPRFAMLALELGLEDGSDPLAGVVVVEPTPVPQLDVLRVNLDGSVACPRCGTGAFERFLNPSMVVCRGCPPPAPTFELPNGFALKYNRYRCDACGRQAQVTMTPSEVLMYCGGCGRLAIHTRQPEAQPPAEKNREARRRLMNAIKRLSPETRASAPVGRRWQSVFVDELNDVLLPDDDPMLVKLTEAMMSILKLEDFDAYRERRRLANRSSDDPRLYLERGTGRTWRGLVELMARHYLATTRPAVWVLGDSERTDAWLRNKVISMRNELGNDHPSKVTAVPDLEQLVRRNLRPPSGVMLFVDHTYYEKGRRGGFAGITYKPDFRKK